MRDRGDIGRDRKREVECWGQIRTHGIHIVYVPLLREGVAGSTTLML